MTKNQFSVSENSVFFGYFLITDNARFSAVNRLCVSVSAGLFARREIPIYPDSTVAANAPVRPHPYFTQKPRAERARSDISPQSQGRLLIFSANDTIFAFRKSMTAR